MYQQSVILRSIEEQLDSSVSWCKAALRETGGISAKYSMIDCSFYPAYPETTGYWIRTLLALSKAYPNIMRATFSGRDVSLTLVEWLISIQRPDGAFPGSYGKFDEQPPVVFNTGQVLLGLLDFYSRTPDSEIYNSSRRAAEWLISVQDDDGAWRKFTRFQYSSNTRTAWALIWFGKLFDERSFIDAGQKNVKFALSLQQDSGYFLQNGFSATDYAYTHTIAYAIRGILESALLTDNHQWMDAAERGFDSIIGLIGDDGRLPGEIDEKLRCNNTFVCLPGNCQMSIIGSKLYSRNMKEEHIISASKLLEFVRSKQLRSSDPAVNGGITGSWPLRGKYNPYEIPNWGVKFFIDAVLEMEDTCQ